MNNTYTTKRFVLIKEYLHTLQASTRIATAFAALAGLCFIMQANTAHAQNFAPVLTNPFSLSDIGTYSVPAFADLDNDGDLDLMAGDVDGNFHYFQNTGTNAAPSFAAAVTNPFSLIGIGANSNSAPAFADLDNDGDFDLMVGQTGGYFFYFQNMGTNAAPVFAAVVTNPFSLTDIGSYSAPAFADLDNDGDFDLMVGQFGGNFFYFQNIGTNAAPEFATVQSNPFHLSRIGGSSAPAFADLDNDGDFDLMAGFNGGGFNYFENTGTNTAPVFAAVVTNPFSLTDIGSNSAPAFADLDNDGDLDLMVGEQDGNFYYFQNTTPPISSWSGSTSSDWNTASNWAPATVPTTYRDVLIEGSPAYQPVIDINDNANCNALTISSGNVLTIESGGSLITNGTITNNGTVDIKQDITDDAWHLISVPNNASTANIFAGDYLQTWSEPNQEWKDIVELITVLNPVQGYGLWGTPDKATTYTFTGTPNTGDQSIGITYTDGKGDNTYYGANLLGNPYPSSIDWNLVSGYGAVYYWNGTAYLAYPETGGFGLGSRYIPPMQGFFIVASAAGTFNLSNAARAHSSTAYYKSINSNSIVLETTSKDYADKLILSFNGAATEGFDLEYDAYKFMSGTEGLSELYSFTGEKMLSIDVRPVGEVIQLGFHNSEAGIYNIGISEIADISEVILEDCKTGSFHKLIDGNYEFEWAVTDDEKRFKLHLNAVGIEEGIAPENSVLIYSDNNQIFIKGADKGTFWVSDMMGRVVLEEAISDSGTTSTQANLKSGVYVVTVLSGDEVRTEKVFIR